MYIFSYNSKEGAHLYIRKLLLNTIIYIFLTRNIIFFPYSRLNSFTQHLAHYNLLFRKIHTDFGLISYTIRYKKHSFTTSMFYSFKYMQQSQFILYFAIVQMGGSKWENKPPPLHNALEHNCHLTIHVSIERLDLLVVLQVHL